MREDFVLHHSGKIHQLAIKAEASTCRGRPLRALTPSQAARESRGGKRVPYGLGGKLREIDPQR